MNYTPDLHIELADGNKIPLLFNSWTYRQFCKKAGIDLDQLLSEAFANRVFKSDNLTDILLTAAESYCRFNNKEFNHTELDAYTWVDSMGGYINSPKTKEIVKVFLMKLLNLSPEKFEELWNKTIQKVEDAKEDKKKGRSK